MEDGPGARYLLRDLTLPGLVTYQVVFVPLVVVCIGFYFSFAELDSASFRASEHGLTRFSGADDKMAFGTPWRSARTRGLSLMCWFRCCLSVPWVASWPSKYQVSKRFVFCSAGELRRGPTLFRFVCVIKILGSSPLPAAKAHWWLPRTDLVCALQPFRAVPWNAGLPCAQVTCP